MTTIQIINLINKRIAELNIEIKKYKDAVSYYDRTHLSNAQSSLKINEILLKFFKSQLPTLEE